MNPYLSIVLGLISSYIVYRATKYSLEVRYKKTITMSFSIIMALLALFLVPLFLSIDVYSLPLGVMIYAFLSYSVGEANRKGLKQSPTLKTSSPFKSDFVTSRKNNNLSDFASINLPENELDKVKLRKNKRATNKISSGNHDKDFFKIAFEYKNSEKVISYREVNVTSCDGICITGYCHTRRSLRTFRVDRILNDEIIIRDSGEILPTLVWLNKI